MRVSVLAAGAISSQGVYVMRMVFGALFLCLGMISPAHAGTKPNVLLICVDDLKPVLGCYGDSIVKSPHIDQLAKRGLLFQRAYCNQAVCAPSRNALLVGLRPQSLGIYELATNFRAAAPDAVTLPQYFQQQGYRTEAMGKIFHVGQGNHEDPKSWSVPHFQPRWVGYALPENRPEPPTMPAKKQAQTNPPRGTAFEAAEVDDAAYGDGLIANEAVKRLRTAGENPDQPFFMAVGFMKPHLPFCAPKKYWDLYNPADFRLAERREIPEGAPRYAAQFGGELRAYKNIPKTGPLPDALQRELIHGYHAAISYTDAQIGRVLTALEEAGLSKNTIIILWGDHGWHLGDHGMWCKHTNYEQATRIPLIVVAPDINAAGTQTNALVETVDIYPTLCELAGLPVPQKLDGTSFVPVLRNPASHTKDAVIHVYPRNPRMGRAIRTARYRLVEWKQPGAPPECAELELYDYKSDSLETKNLAASQPDVVAVLKKVLATHPEAKAQIRTPDPQAKNPRPPINRDALFNRKDKDGDGKLTREEFLANQPDPKQAPTRFKRFDRDNDGVLSRIEFVTMGQ